jgi:hypothetical protein
LRSPRLRGAVTMFRRVRGIWELLSPERRAVYWTQGKTLEAEG